MIERHIKHRVLGSLDEAPAVALLGPRQVGKTTLARDIAGAVPDSLYLDLENPDDAALLADPVRYRHSTPRPRFPVALLNPR